MKIIFEYGSNGGTKKRLILPVNPESLRVNRPSSAQKVNVIGLGQVSIPQSPDLVTISIKSFFWKYLFDNILQRYTTDIFTESLSLATIKGVGSEGLLIDDSKKFKLLNEYVDWFNEWQESKEHARLTVVTMPNEPKQNIDFEVTCESFDWDIRAGEEGDYYYELNLLEWKNISAQELSTKTDENGNIIAEKNNGNLRTTIKEKVQEVRTKPTDTLWGIARKYGEGKYDDWQRIYEITQNKDIIANNITNLNNLTLKMPTEWLK